MKRSSLILTGLFLIVRVFAQTPWSVSGNSGTTASNFIGTTDRMPLIFKTNNQWAGFTGFPDKNNVSFGYLSLTNAQGTGSANTALGAQSLQYSSTASGNVGLGTWALQWCSQGDNNTAVGLSAMGNSRTVGNSNVAIGHTALFNNNNQSGNTAVGAASLYTNTEGDGLTAVGFKSLCNNTVGDFNTAVGFQALLMNTTGFWNVAVGSGSLQNNRTGYFNTASGNSSLHFNTTGVENTAFGEQALAGNLEGSYNTAVGCRSLWSVLYTPGAGDSGYGHASANTAVGYESLSRVTTGSNNVAIGNNALKNNKTGNYNVAIGAGAGVGKDNLTNTIAIGYGAVATASNQIVLGNNKVTSVWMPTNYTTSSDRRIKKNIRQDVPGLDFINRLEPVTYDLDLDALDKLQNTVGTQGYGGKPSNNQNSSDVELRAANQERHSGFIAQDVEDVAKSIGYEFNGVDAGDTNNGLYGLRYSKFIVPLVKAVQELSDRIDAKDATIAALQKRIDQMESADNSAIELLRAHVEQWGEWEQAHSQLSYDLERRIGDLNEIADSTIDAMQTHVAQWGDWEHDHQKLSNALQTQITDLNETAVRLEAYHLPTSNMNVAPPSSVNNFLEQNFPNPFNHTTTINYTLPQHFHSAKIIITDMSGKIVKIVPVSSGFGTNSVRIDAGSLSAGMYFYSLELDNNLVDTKKMVLTK